MRALCPVPPRADVGGGDEEVAGLDDVETSRLEVVAQLHPGDFDELGRLARGLRAVAEKGAEGADGTHGTYSKHRESQWQDGEPSLGVSRDPPAARWRVRLA
mgnify:CR=1 FL=1